MALPKNKNIRKITVDEICYYWTIKYDEDYGIINCNVGLEDKPNHTFTFVRGADNSHKKHIHNGVDKKDEVKAITPKLIREAIEFANANLDWKNAKKQQIYSNTDGFSM